MSMGGGAPDVSSENKALGQQALDMAKPLIEQAGKSSQRAEDFGYDFFDKYLKKLSDQMGWSVSNALDKNNQITAGALDQFNRQTDQAKEAAPMIKDWQDTIKNYNAEEDAGRTTALGIGDLTQAETAQKAAAARALRARGIDESSGGGTAGIRDQAMQAALARAGIAQKERARAEALGLQLKQAGANMGMSLQSAPLAALGAASGSVGQGVQIPATGASGLATAAGVPMQGAGLATTTGASLGGNLYNSGMSTITSANNAQAKADSESSAGFGKLVGQVAGMALPLLL